MPNKNFSSSIIFCGLRNIDGWIAPLGEESCKILIPLTEKTPSIIGTNAPPVIKFCVGFLFLFDFLCERNVQSQSAGSLSIIYKWSAIYVARERALPGIAKFMPQGWWASSMGLRGVLCLRNTPLGRSAHRKLRTRVCVLRMDLLDVKKLSLRV